MSQKKLLVISVDAFMHGDLQYLDQLPTFSRIVKNCSKVAQMTSIYPTLTLPAHVAIATGCYPMTNGVNHNEATLRSGKDQPWNWYVDICKVPFFWDKAKEAGYTTASIGWPVNGNAKADYVMPDIWTPNVDDDPTELFASAGAANIIDTVFNKNKHLMHWNFHPKYDRFVAACAADVVRLYTPDVLFVHVSPVDDFRHKYGTYGDHILEAMKEVDSELAVILAAYDEAGWGDKLDIALLGDHGQLTVERIVRPNVLFAREGFIKPDPETGWDDNWQVFCRSCGFSATVYLKDMNDKALYDRVYALLKEYAAKPEYGIGEVMTREECKARWKVDGDYAFVLETDGKTGFGADAMGEPVVYEGFSPSNHGYMPDKGDKPPFIVSGPSFKEGVVLDSANTVDIAVTLAKPYGIDMSHADGQVLKALLK